MALLEQLDDAGVRELSRQSDDLGVLSVYVNADPSQDPNLLAAGIDLKNRFRELQRRASEGDGIERGRDVAAALERLWPQVETLVTPAVSGRGRIVFLALDSDWTMQFESAMPVATRLVLDSGPFIHPLLELLDEGRRAGVVVITAEDARLLEWHLGSLRTVQSMENEYVQAPHERAGQIGGGPPGQFNTPVREQRKARERERSERFLDHVVEAAVKVAEENGWQRILVSGGDTWTEAAVSRFPQPVRDRVLADSRVLSGVDDASLARMLTERLHAQHKEYEQQLLTEVRDAAGTKSGALGLSEVTGALNDGRVAHLVYDPEVRYVGSVDANGLLYAGAEAPAGAQVTAEPRLTERLVERALEIGARITPVEGAAAGGVLAEADGIGALLRW
ncbi:MSMEG_1130 family ribosome hibernation factor [Mycolicibacterium elephantis]